MTRTGSCTLVYLCGATCVMHTGLVLYGGGTLRCTCLTFPFQMCGIVHVLCFDVLSDFFSYFCWLGCFSQQRDYENENKIVDETVGSALFDVKERHRTMRYLENQ